MINWIDIDLPWHVYTRWEEGPEQPDLQEREREVFGLSLEDSSKVNEHHLETYTKLRNEVIGLQRDAGFDFSPDSETNRIGDEFWAKHANHESVLARNAHIALEQKISDWSDEQPEWKAHAKAVEEFSAQNKLKSFTGRGLALPGTIIEMEDGSIEFIGSINVAGGCCNDCPAFDDDLIVKRYALVYPFIKKAANEDCVGRDE